jgi:uncharacterized low-complexity protein
MNDTHKTQTHPAADADDMATTAPRVVAMSSASDQTSDLAAPAEAASAAAADAGACGEAMFALHCSFC